MCEKIQCEWEVLSYFPTERMCVVGVKVGRWNAHLVLRIERRTKKKKKERGWKNCWLDHHSPSSSFSPRNCEWNERSLSFDNTLMFDSIISLLSVLPVLPFSLTLSLSLFYFFIFSFRALSASNILSRVYKWAQTANRNLARASFMKIRLVVTHGRLSRKRASGHAGHEQEIAWRMYVPWPAPDLGWVKMERVGVTTHTMATHRHHSHLSHQ